MPYDLLGEAKKDELRSLSLDLLRYMKVAGFEPSKTRPSLQRMLSERDSTNNCFTKFSLQFFDTFMEFLSKPSQQGAEFYLKVLFPVMTGYLQKYAGYFMPTSDMQASGATASRNEKMKILK